MTDVYKGHLAKLSMWLQVMALTIIENVSVSCFFVFHLCSVFLTECTKYIQMSKAPT